MSYFNSATIPYVWTNQDTGNSVLASIRAIKPSWASTCAGFHSGMSLLTLSPLGYASYRIIKNTAGLSTTRSKIAIGIYAASMFFAASSGSAIKAGCYAGVNNF
uniref:Uncharacterized protein n=1 Tax=Panagrolaimus sp. ES5 TaxID=591445 RepID=A0AC34GGX6_9BILA